MATTAAAAAAGTADRGALLCGLALLVLAMPGTLGRTAAHQLRPDSASLNDSKHICTSMDIRNTPEAFLKLKGCEVIEGSLHILLFDNLNEKDLAEIQFPKLTEITDYLLFFRVNGLRSIGQLFPNLAVIRGQNTLSSKALIIFEMSSLQEIGLHSLTDISQGTVQIDKNPSLCFVHTVDWDRIIHQDADKKLLRSLKPENECPICPADVGGRVTCPHARFGKTDNYEKGKHLCWNKNHCQKVCPDNCTACDGGGACCDPLCLGGCLDGSPKACTVCRDLAIGSGRNKQCMTKCPPGYYKYLNRRCVTKEECIGMPKPPDIHSSVEEPFTYKIFNDSCVTQCPTNYKSNLQNHTCTPCGGRCEKYCDGINIDSISLVKQLRGCTHIKGPLEIQIRGGTNVVTELEENLSMIEEISGYLKVVRSFSLISLNFLKNLKRIKGINLESGKYVFVVLDNQNLQELWDWKNRTLQIDKGKLFFHFNPKLCKSKIIKLQEMAHLQDVSELEVASNSNGDKIACNVMKLSVNVTTIDSKSVTLEWKHFKMDDQRSLLAYTLYCIEAPYKNITLYDGRDACGKYDNWRVFDIPYQEHDESVVQLLPNLKPYTQYAFYVKTYTIASERNGAQSEIQYFRTKPAMPSSPQNLQVTRTNSSDSLLITWSPPASPNGNITHYIISGSKHSNGYMYLKERDYCKDPPIGRQVSPTIAIPTPPPKNDTCSCEEERQNRISINELEEQARIKFEDELHNKVYVKRTSADIQNMMRDKNTKDFGARKKRESTKGTKLHMFPNTTDSLQNEKNSLTQNITENGTDIWESFSFSVYGNTQFFITKLHHYTFYDISVQACREKEKDNEDKENSCSSTSMQTQRTLHKLGADDIKKFRITNQTLNTVTITWDLPEDPNGIILYIVVEYKRVDIVNAKPTSECITSNDLKNESNSYTISNLYTGNYSLRILARSTAGDGAPSEYVYFLVKEQKSDSVVLIISIVSVFLIIILCLFTYLYRKHQKEKEKIRIVNPSVNPEYVPSVYLPDEWEVSRKNVDLLKELGQGSFGMVWEGLAHDIRGKPEIKCAVKTVNEHATNRERLEFLNEASVMKAFDTTHVVRLLGVVSQSQPTLVIMELMANGDLKSYLRSHRPDIENYDPTLIKHPPTLRQILQMAAEIADGMAYLSAKKFVHRDLAARNCMVAEDLTVKIGDFGMTRDIYETDYYRKGTKGLLPVRWMAPESLKDGVFTSSSDAWSYGVVLWEMATLASQPYQGLSNDQVLRYVIDGGVMERPENCPDKLYTLMRYCWQHKPASRPSFLKLCQLLLDDANPRFAHVSFYHSPSGAEARQAKPAPSPSQDDPSTPLRTMSNRLGGYTPSASQDSDDIDIDTHHRFPIMSESGIGATTANGYVSGCPKNGAATTQC